MPAHKIVELGVVQSPEGRRVFPRMTVLENLEMGAFSQAQRSIRRTWIASSSCFRA